MLDVQIYMHICVCLSKEGCLDSDHKRYLMMLSELLLEYCKLSLVQWLLLYSISCSNSKALLGSNVITRWNHLAVWQRIPYVEISVHSWKDHDFETRVRLPDILLCQIRDLNCGCVIDEEKYLYIKATISEDCKSIIREIGIPMVVLQRIPHKPRNSLSDIDISLLFCSQVAETIFLSFFFYFTVMLQKPLFLDIKQWSSIWR